jgi:hypothetical protein
MPFDRPAAAVACAVAVTVEAAVRSGVAVGPPSSSSPQAANIAAVASRAMPTVIHRPMISLPSL